MLVLRTVALFALTAVAEILGCYLPYLWLRQGRSAWLLVPGAVSLAAFALAAHVAPPYGGGAHVCRLRRRIRGDRRPLAVDDRRPASRSMGPHWGQHHARGNGSYRLRTTPLTRPARGLKLWCEEAPMEEVPIACRLDALTPAE